MDAADATDTVPWAGVSGKPATFISDWLQVVGEAKRLGFSWGGDWTSSTDYPHFEMTFGLSTAQWRAGRRPTQAQLAAAQKRIFDGDVPAPKFPAARVLVNDREVAYGLIIDDRALAPLRAVGEAASCVVGWDNATKTATVDGKTGSWASAGRRDSLGAASGCRGPGRYRDVGWSEQDGKYSRGIAKAA